MDPTVNEILDLTNLTYLNRNGYFVYSLKFFGKVDIRKVSYSMETVLKKRVMVYKVIKEISVREM